MTRIRSISLRSAVLAILLFAAALLLVSSSTAAARPHQLDNYACTPDYVAAFTNRVHAHCTVPFNGTIQWFAVCSTGSGSANASRALSIFTTAKVTGKNLRFYFTASDTSGTACGCGAGDCRVISGVEVMP